MKNALCAADTAAFLASSILSALLGAALLLGAAMADPAGPANPATRDSHGQRRNRIGRDRGHRRKARIDGSGHGDQPDGAQRRRSLATEHHGAGGFGRQGAWYLAAHLGSRSDGVRGARPVSGRRCRGDRRFLPRRDADIGVGDCAQRPYRHRCRPFRSEQCGSAARPAGHPVRLGLDGRHDQARHQSTQTRRVRGGDGRERLPDIR